MTFTVVVDKKERNFPKISQVNLQGLFYLLARQFYILPDVLLFLYLSIIAYRTYSSARYLFAYVANTFALKIRTKSFLLLKASVNIKLMCFLS